MHRTQFTKSLQMHGHQSLATNVAQRSRIWNLDMVEEFMKPQSDETMEEFCSYTVKTQNN
jgi:hypothetical protein